MDKVTVAQVEHIAFSITRDLFTFNEPIPDFTTRFSNALESCLETPFQTFDRKNFYPTLEKKASILFYLMIKNHPFQNGNKRIAVTTLFYVLHREKKWLTVDTEELYMFAVFVAGSPRKAKDQVVQYIEKFIKDNMVPFKPLMPK